MQVPAPLEEMESKPSDSPKVYAKMNVYQHLSYKYHFYAEAIFNRIGIYGHKSFKMKHNKTEHQLVTFVFPKPKEISTCQFWVSLFLTVRVASSAHSFSSKGYFCYLQKKSIC